MFEKRIVKIYFPMDGVTVELKVASSGEFRFRLLEEPLTVESTSIFDVIEVRLLSGNEFEFVRVVEKSGWRTWQFLITEIQVHSSTIAAIIEKVEKSGGRWERNFGGYLTISLPPNSAYNPTEEIKALEIEK